MEYHLQYINSIKEGLDNTEYYKDLSKIEATKFYSDIIFEIEKIKNNNDRLFFLGNGASAAFANHMALDFSKNGSILSRSLSDSALLTALSNDYSYDAAFIEFLKIEGVNDKDLVITISSSGNSSNIVNTIKFCKKEKIKTLSFSGLKKNNKSLKYADYSIYVQMKTYGMVECIHQIFLHLILDKLMKIQEWNRDEYQNMNIKSLKL